MLLEGARGQTGVHHHHGLLNILWRGSYSFTNHRGVCRWTPETQEEVQGHFSSTSGHYTSSRAWKQFLRSLLVAGCAQPLSGSLRSAASLWLPPPAPLSFEARPCLMAPGVHIAVLSHSLPFKAEPHAPHSCAELTASRIARQRLVLPTPCHNYGGRRSVT